MYVINSERTLISLKEAPVKFFFLFSIPIKAFFFFFLFVGLVGGGGGGAEGEPYVSLFMWGN